MILKGAVFRGMAEALQDEIRQRQSSTVDQEADKDAVTTVTAVQNMHAAMLLIGASVLDRMDRPTAAPPKQWPNQDRDAGVLAE